MRSLSLPFGIAALASAAGAASVQGVDRRVELNEFAVPADAADRAVDQVSGPEPQSIPADRDQTDRTVAVSQARTSPGVAIAQVSSRSAPADPAQITQEEGLRSDIAALSSRAQSAPGSVTRLEGTDRCDPQGDPARYQACLRILERRADEFAAPTAPRLSAEEALLAQRAAYDKDPATLTINQRISRASQSDPDADLTSNQELASIILTGSGLGQTPVDPTEDDAAPRAAEIDAALRAIGIPVQPQP